MQHKIGILTASAIGDAYGCGYEYAPEKTVVAFNEGLSYLERSQHKIPGGTYTDDTQMSLAIAEALISGEPWTPSNLAERFVTVFKRDPRKGYAKRFQVFLEKVENGQDFIEQMYLGGGGNSDKSGGAMRASPLGILPAIGDIISKCRIQASLTHNSTDGQNAAIAASLMTHYFVYKLGPKKEVGQFITEFVAGQWDCPWVGPVGAKGWMSVRAAIWSVVESKSMTELLKRCISWSGDVDTVATIAMAAASHCDEIENNLPPVLFNELENGTFGRDYLMDLDNQLLRLKG